jgi:hypothetical protein
VVPIVLLLDQRASRATADRVAAWSERLNATYGEGLARAFVRTAGDEMQAVLGGPAHLASIVADSVREGGWWIGVGVGEVERPLPATAREGRGSAFWAARDAVERAKGQRAGRPVRVLGDDGTSAERLEACLGVLAWIITRRSPRQRVVADAVLRVGLSGADVAAELGLTRQGAVKQIAAAGCREELDLRALAAALAAQDACATS